MNQKRIIVLGAGMVGSAIAADLCNEYSVTISDKNRVRLEYLKDIYPLETITTDLSFTSDLREVIKDFDLVISAVPGSMGFKTLNAVISAGKDVVDISFFNQDPFMLETLAKEKGVTAVVDCGIAPGLNNMILGFLNSQFKVDSFKCYVGGLPVERTFPFQYKAPFSPSDVIEEYVRPARLVSNSQIVVKEALSDPELINFDNIGTLEAFNTDGLRTLIKTMKIPNMVEKTLRYPGHIDLMRIFRNSGFFSTEEIKINDKNIAPLDLTSKLLFKQWQLGNEEEEFTIMKIFVKGRKENQKVQYNYHIYDRYDPVTKISSMARTTGYTCTAVARLILEDKFVQKGIIPPEYIAASDGNLELIFNMLRERNINIQVHTKPYPAIDA